MARIATLIAARGFDDLETDRARVNHNFTGVWEVDGDAIENGGLDLPHAPIGLLRVADTLAGFDVGMECRHIVSTAGRTIGSGPHSWTETLTMVGSCMPVADDWQRSGFQRLGLELATALCARLCHDFSSPLGTIAGTLEFAAEQPAEADEGIAVASEATANLVRRLRLVRAAWAGDCGPLDHLGLQTLAAGLTPGITVDLDRLEEQIFSADLACVLLNLMMLGSEALPRGGVVTLAGGLPGGIVLRVAGPSVGWSAALGQALLDPSAMRAEPRSVQIPLTIALVRAAELRLSFLLAPDCALPTLLLCPR